MNHPSMKKILLAIGILALFINSSIVSTNTADIITKDHTNSTQIVQRSPQQEEDIRRIFDALQGRLSTSQSPRETQQIINDTILILASHHLLPPDLSIKEAQRIVHTNHRIHPILQKLSQQLQLQKTEGTIQNTFCSIAGNTTNTHFAKLAKRTALRLYYIIDFNTGNAPLNKMATALFVVFNEIAKINQKILRQNGSHLGVCIYFGNYHYAPYPDWLSPAQGWISTDGVHGKQNITGSFWGQTMTGGWQPQVDWYMNYTWRGCLGFTGLIYYTGADNAYFLGSALAVNIGPNRP